MRRKLFFTAIFTVILSVANSFISFAYEKEIKSLSASMAESTSKARKKTIAVVDFTDLQGNVTQLGRFLAEEFSVAISATEKGFEVVDRTHLKSIIAEHKLSATGLIDPQTAKKLGQIAGVDALITGTITPFGDSVRVSVKVLDTSTAKVIGGSSGDIAKTKAIEELLAKGIETTTGTPSPTAPVKQAAKAQQRVEVMDFIFELQSCKVSGQSVTCQLLITNKGKDQRLAIKMNGSRIIDDLGNEYHANKVNLGNKESNSFSYYAETQLVSEIPIKASLRFDNVSSQIGRLSILEIRNSSNDSFVAQFRNIPLTK